MVRLLIFKLIEKHLKIKEIDDFLPLYFKQIVIDQLTGRFRLNDHITKYHICTKNCPDF